MEKVEVQLSNDEALILFDWLATAGDRPDFEAMIGDRLVSRLLWDIEAILEKALAGSLPGAFSEAVREARARLTSRA